MSKFHITHWIRDDGTKIELKPLVIDEIDMNNIRGGVGSKTKCTECEEGTLEFVSCDDDNNVTEMMYECNLCHMPKIINLKGEPK